MPSPQATLTVEQVYEHVERQCLPPGPDARVGVEMEWLTISTADPARPVPHELVERRLAGVHLPGGSLLTFEPGGQLELSTAPAPSAWAACDALATDAQAVAAALAGSGVGLAGMGLDPLRSCQRVLQLPRYVAMEAYFDGDGPAGRTMMCLTAALQVNLDAGPAGAVDARWRLANQMGPVLGAAFACSPFAAGRPTGWKSARLATWLAIDPTRTAPPAPHPGGAAAGWAAYALAARVMLVRQAPDRLLPPGPPLTFAEWMRGGHELGFPTLDDLDYHLTTLFPPVRPRGWLELRMIDSLPDPWWRVAVLVAAALLYDGPAAERARAACAPVAGLWRDAARDGLGHAGLAAAAATCFTAALEAVEADGRSEAAGAVAAFCDRFVWRGRCPADDLLDNWAATGELLPVPNPRELSWT